MPSFYWRKQASILWFRLLFLLYITTYRHMVRGGEKITVVGSGNFGSAIARLVARNVANKERYDPVVRMWVYEEEVGDRLLSEIINTDHENPKYLPGIQLPPSVRAITDLSVACENASVVIFVLPHQFLKNVLPIISQSIRPDAIGVSLIKGMEFDDQKPLLISDMIREGFKGPLTVLMGANVADEVARDEFCEATVGCSQRKIGEHVQELFKCHSFRVDVVEDPVGVEVCGALKNVVALGAGFCDGLGLGGNTKAAIIRIGLVEMRRFCHEFFQGVEDSTFFESCGVADLITTCYGGRNRRCAEEFAKLEGRCSWEKIEEEQLGGQKLQGIHTCQKLMAVIRNHKLERNFPLFTRIHSIAYEGVHPTRITDLDDEPS